MEIFKKGDKVIVIKNDFIEEKEIESISISLAANQTNYCFEVINLMFTDNDIFSLGQSKGCVHKIVEKINVPLEEYSIPNKPRILF